MNIIIVGCGRVGATLAEQLNEEGNNITVVDCLPERVEALCARTDVMGVVGNGATQKAQLEAGVESADLLIAVTGSDELNLLCCMVAKISGNCQTIARVADPEYSTESTFLKEQLGLAMVVNPDYAAAAEIARVLRFPSAIKIDTFAKGKVELVKFRLPEGSPLVGMSVKEAVSRLHADVLFCTVERDTEAYIVNGDFVIEERDVISFVAAPKSAAAFFRRVGHAAKPVKDVMLVGGSEIAEYLSELLTRSGIAVKIIEKEAAVCERLAEAMPAVTVIHGDGSDQETLTEEGVATAGAFVALTHIDEENILFSLYAKQSGAGKVVTKIKRTDFSDVIRTLDLDTIIYPKNITAELIVRYVRAMRNSIGSNVETLYNLIKGKAEAAEFIIRESSPVVGVPLCDLRFKTGVLIAAIIRDGQVIIPRGQDTIETGDAVVVVSGLMALHDITDILL